MPGINDIQLQKRGGTDATAALLAGMGSATSPVAVGAVANKNVVGMWTKTTAATGDSRAIYWRHYFGGAGGGEVARLWATATTTGVAAGGTMNALHATASINASSSVAGALNAIRATLSAAASATMGGTGAALQLDSDVATGLTVPASWGFISVTDSGVTRINRLMLLPAAANGTLVAAHTTDGMTHSIKVRVGTTDTYIMCTTTATNRS
jgi:hypothetical protein